MVYTVAVEYTRTVPLSKFLGSGIADVSFDSKTSFDDWVDATEYHACKRLVAFPKPCTSTVASSGLHGGKLQLIREQHVQVFVNLWPHSRAFSSDAGLTSSSSNNPGRPLQVAWQRGLHRAVAILPRAV